MPILKYADIRSRITNVSEQIRSACEMLRSVQNKTLLAFRSIITSALFSLGTTLVILLLSRSDFFHSYELKSLDFFQRLNKPLEDPTVCLLEIDQRSLTALSDQGIRWPWPRQIYSPMIEILNDMGAEAIIFDIIFSEPSSYGVEDDAAFAEAIEQAGNVFLPVAMSLGGENQTDISPIARFGWQGEATGRAFKEAKSYVPPIEQLARGARGLGDVIIAPDPDGIYRRIPLFTRYQDYLFPALALAPLRNRFHVEKGHIDFDDEALPVDQKGELLLHYYGKAFDFPRFSVLDALSAHQNPDGDLFRRSMRQIEGRFVLIGLTAPGLHDLKPTAVTSTSPGAYVHATLLANLLDGHHIEQIDAVWKYLMTFALGFTLGLVIIAVVSFWTNSLIFLSFVAGWAAGSFLIFHHSQHWIGIVPYEACLFVIFGLTSTYSYHTEGKRRRLIRQLFSQYMSEVLVKELEANPEKAKLGGDRRFITIFFSDLADFTTLSERLAPEKIVALLNDYFTEMSQIILDSQGIIDKYQGDGIMAFWGAPISSPEHALMACAAALHCQQRMERINDGHRGERLGPLVMRIGLHSGEAIVGNMGSEQRFDYTIIGDSVNLASRLEGVNKQFGTNIIISETTYDLTREQMEARELDLIAVKGKERPIRIFQLLGWKGQISESDGRLKFLFETGLERYRARDFIGALEMFRAALEVRPDDQPSHQFLARCRGFIQTPPPAHWDGVFRLSEK